MRQKEADINCLNSSGIPQPLGRIQRLHKWDTTGIIPDDKFVSLKSSLTLFQREMGTTNQQEVQNPKVHHVKE
jgi:hypothetical protein